MGLVELQQTLALLYTDKTARAALPDDNMTFGKTRGLTVDETRSLMLIADEDLNQFACSLRAKRMGEVFTYLPLTRCALGDSGTSWFDRYWGQRRSSANSNRQDAIDFVKFIVSTGPERGLPLWTIDLARLEAAPIEMHVRRRRLRWIVLRFRPMDLVDAAREAASQSPPHCRRIVLWLRISRTRTMRQILLPLPVFAAKRH